MNTPSNILLLPERGIRRCPPKDRAVWLVANIIRRDGACTECEPYEGYAAWNEGTLDWHDLFRMSIKGDYDAEVHAIEWMELSERAKDAPPHETDVDANVYHWDSEWRRETGTAGFYALCNLRHSPTSHGLSERCEGPYATQAEALAVLCGLVADLVNQRIAEAAQAEAA